MEIIRKVADYEPVLLVVKSREQRERVRAMLGQAHADRGNVRCVIVNTNRSWMRDSGPVVVQRSDGTREALQFRFNGGRSTRTIGWTPRSRPRSQPRCGSR